MQPTRQLVAEMASLIPATRPIGRAGFLVSCVPCVGLNDIQVLVARSSQLVGVVLGLGGRPIVIKMSQPLDSRPVDGTTRHIHVHTYRTYPTSPLARTMIPMFEETLGLF